MAKKQVVFKRPYATHYFTSVTDKAPSFTSHGSCASEQGAIRASVVRIFMGQYQKAVVIDRELQVVIYTIKHSAEGLKVVYGREVESHHNHNLRRVA